MELWTLVFSTTVNILYKQLKMSVMEKTITKLIKYLLLYVI